MEVPVFRRWRCRPDVGVLAFRLRDRRDPDRAVVPVTKRRIRDRFLGPGVRYRRMNGDTSRPSARRLHDKELRLVNARLHPFMLARQKAAENFAGAFTPRTQWGLFWRNQATKAFAIPFVAGLLRRSSLLDRLDLPDCFGSASLPETHAAGSGPSRETARGSDELRGQLEGSSCAVRRCLHGMMRDRGRFGLAANPSPALCKF